MNKVLLLGIVDKEPEIRYVDKGVCVAQLTMRTTDHAFSTNAETEIKEVNEFHRVILWRELGEIIERNVHKGSTIYVEGKLHYRSYTDRSGITFHLVEVWANSLEIIK